MKVETMKWIAREIVRANPDKAFLFGDNLCRKGFGGQAKEMRGEPNAFGIVTKYSPSLGADAFFTDETFSFNCMDIDNDIAEAVRSGLEIVVLPADGIGTGLAELDKRAPRTFAYLQKRLAELDDQPTEENENV